jgi:NAD(P)H dehydrogenase (quinone)
MTTYAIPGATGGLGGRVARHLADRGVPMRLIVRDPTRAPKLPGAEVARASYDDTEAMKRALDGVTTLLLVSAAEDEDRRSLHRSLVDTTVAAGVERVVYTSFLGAAPDATFTFARDHWHTEQQLRASGVRFTFLRDNLYLDYLPLMADKHGVIRGPAGDGKVGAVARDDIGEVAAAVLLEQDDRHDGRTYDLTGPAALSFHDAAEALSRVSGRTVTYHPETVEEAYASRAAYGAPDWEVAGWVTTYLAIAAGELDVVTGAVEQLAGHPPTSLADFLRAHPESWAHLEL